MDLVFKLRRRFIIFSMAVVIAFVAVLVVTSQINSQRDAYAQMYAMMEQLAARPAAIEGAPQDISAPFPYIVIDHELDGTNWVVGSGSVRSEIVTNMTQIVDQILSGTPQQGNIAADDLLYLVRNKPDGSLSIVLADAQSTNTQLNRAFIFRCAIALGAIGAFLLLTSWMARRATRPLEKAWDAQQRFISDASHELKTPLTVILANAELLGATEGLSPKAATYTQNITSQARYMRTLTEQLLYLSRADHAAENYEVIDLSSAVSSAALSFEPLAFEAGHPLAVEADEGLHVVGTVQAITQIVSILLDNAVKYSEGTKGQIALSLKREGRWGLLRVANPGTPLTPEQRSQVFERFWQKDEARQDGRGFGLGLAIAVSLTRALGGSISVESKTAKGEPGGTNTFVVKLPLVKSGGKSAS